MINKIMPRGRDIGGLVRYLFGPGDANEHTGQRIIAADLTLGIADGTRLDRPEHWEQVLALGRDLDGHRRLAAIAPADGWVWHAAISLAPGERLDDAQWADIARTVVDRLGFTEDTATGRAACRWIAVHHGPSGGGHDHIHLAVVLVREDGTIAAPGRDRMAMSRLCADMEARFGLAVVEGRPGRGMPGYHRARRNQARQQSQGRVRGRAQAARSRPAGRVTELETARLARTVRAAAAAAGSEQEFVALVRAAGLRIRPRYARGGQDQVIGYSVAARPTKADPRPLWYGGGRLAADLTLPRLREHWADDSAEARAAALAGWRPLRQPDRPGRWPADAPGHFEQQTWDQAAERIALLRQRLAAVPPGDSAAWASAARHAAGVLAILSARIEGARPGPLAHAADTLARSAQTPPGRPRASRAHGLADLRGVAQVAATARREGPGQWLVLIVQIIALIDAIAEAQRAQQQARHAAELATLAHDRLARLQRAASDPGWIAAAEAAEAARLAFRDNPTGRPRLSPEPGTRPPRPRPTPRPGPGRGFGR